MKQFNGLKNDMRVVLDTNILLSAFLWQKELKPIYQAICLKKITPCFTQKTWAELLRALAYKKFEKQLLKINICPDEITELISDRSHFTISNLQISEIKQDLSDNDILACALISKAFFIISGDKHLLKLKEFHGIPILQPKEFLRILKK